MGVTYTEIPDYLIEWIEKQHIFWVASAPLSGDGHINISPKGVAGTFHIANANKVWYEDLSGSGAETIAHIRENGRITVLFNAFEGPPRIVRLYGKGSYHEFGTAEYNRLLPLGTRQPGSRAVIVVDVYRIGSTCGYSVPYYSFVGHRIRLLDWAAKREKHDFEHLAESPSDFADLSPANDPAEVATTKERKELHPNGMLAWWRDRNDYSIDGLPGLSSAFKSTLGIGTHKAVPKGISHSAQRHRSSLKSISRTDFRVTSDIQTGAGQQVILKGLFETWRWIAWITMIGPFILSFRIHPRQLLFPIQTFRPTSNSDMDKCNLKVNSAGCMTRKESSEAGATAPAAWTQGIFALSGVKIPFLGYAFSFLLGMMFAMFLKELQRNSPFRALLVA